MPRARREQEGVAGNIEKQTNDAGVVEETPEQAGRQGLWGEGRTRRAF